MHKYSLWSLFVILNFIIFLPILIGGVASPTTTPNIVIILADDMGYGDLGPYDHDNNPNTPPVTDSPRLDQMAAEGVKLTDFYAAATVCTPTRASLLTGRHHIRAGITGVFFADDPDGLDPSEILLPEVLDDRGYTSFIVGKWHLGSQMQYLPLQQGFDHFYGAPYSNDIEPFYLLRDNTVIDNNPDQDYLTQNFTNEAKQYISDAVAQDTPFLLYMPHTAPHTPVHVSPAFEGQSPRGLYGDVIREIDWSVGQILDHLTALGIDDDTIVIFTDDNGAWEGTPPPDDPEPERWVGGINDPFNGEKGSLFEGGIRVPFIARWPGQLPSGLVSAETVHIFDLFPTLIHLAGGEVPINRVIDGEDIWDVLTDTGTRSTDDFYFYVPHHFNDVEELGAMRSGNWKLHFDSQLNPTDLYDLSADIGETTPIDDPVLKDLLADQASYFHNCTLREPPSGNVALRTIATASSTLNSNSPDRVVDFNATTFWESAATDNEWMIVNLGSAHTITQVGLGWDAAYGLRYEIQVSLDGINWTAVYVENSGDGGEDTITGLNATAQYVRFWGVERGTAAGYALREFELYGTEVGATNLALNRPTVASSSRNQCRIPLKVNDGNSGTRWESNWTNSQWIYVDLGVPTAFNKVILHWEAAYALQYQIQVSNNASTWTTVFTESNGNGGFDVISGLAANGRYVRMRGTVRATTNGYSLWEFKVYNEDTTATPTPTATATATPSPTPTSTPSPTPTVTPSPTFTPTPIPGQVLYLSADVNGTVSGIAYADEDILTYDTTTDTWAMYFDGSDVGLGPNDVDGFMLWNGQILLSIGRNATLGSLTGVTGMDIVRFVPTSLGTTTAGTFEWFFDGSDVELTTTGESVDAIGFLQDGRLLISTGGNMAVTGVTAADEDIAAFTATTWGEATSGTWELYFDGSDVALTAASEDVWGVWVDTNSDIYLTTQGTFAVTGSSGDGNDIFICTPGSLGATTSCTFSPGVYWDGSSHGFLGSLDALMIQ